MKKTDASWAIAMTVGLCFAAPLGCSSHPDEPTGGSGAGGSSTGGTGGAGGANPDAGPAFQQACADLAAATCQKVGQCLPWYVPKWFGDTNACVARYLATECLPYWGAPGSNDTPAMVQACAAARTAATCAQWYDNDVSVSACLPHAGTRPKGASCGSPTQCQSANCEYTAATECGACGGPLVGAGSPCSFSGECSGNLQCVNGVCGLPGGLGATCSSEGPCQFAFVCANGKCAVPAQAGESCATLACNSRAGLVCVNGVCEPRQFAGAGEPCNLAKGRDCGRAGFCETKNGLADGICIPSAAEGEPCDSSFGPYCVPFAVCLGTCVALDPKVCR